MQDREVISLVVATRKWEQKCGVFAGVHLLGYPPRTWDPRPQDFSSKKGLGCWHVSLRGFHFSFFSKTIHSIVQWLLKSFPGWTLWRQIAAMTKSWDSRSFDAVLYYSWTLFPCYCLLPPPPGWGYFYQNRNRLRGFFNCSAPSAFSVWYHCRDQNFTKEKKINFADRPRRATTGDSGPLGKACLTSAAAASICTTEACFRHPKQSPFIKKPQMKKSCYLIRFILVKWFYL